MGCLFQGVRGLRILCEPFQESARGGGLSSIVELFGGCREIKVVNAQSCDGLSTQPKRE